MVLPDLATDLSMRLLFASTALALLAAAVPASAQAPSPAIAQGASGAINLAPHRAVYDLSLARSGGSRGVEGARGRIALDFGGDACEGYALKYRQVTVLESGETGGRTADLRTTTFEDGEGRSFRFKTDSALQSGAPTSVDGEAEREPSEIEVRLRRPKRDSFPIPADTLFPSAHMKRLIEAARVGETTISVKVFDGSDDGRKVYDTLAVIGRRIEPGPIESEPASKQEALAKTARWPVTLSYFAPGDGERTPIYVISFEMYENGVSRALTLDYGEFALKGAVQSIEMLPPSACQR
jgi:envelope integrity protein B